MVNNFEKTNQATFKMLEASDEDIQAMENGRLTKFLQDNPIETVFDLDDEPAEFARYKLNDEKLIEVDKNMPSQELLELVQKLRKVGPFNRGDYFTILPVLRHKVRFMTTNCVAEVVYIATGRG